MKGRGLRPSPALVVAIIALFVALGGTAGAVMTQVPLAKRALVADNAKKLGGKTLGQVAAQAAAAPGPASTAAGLVSIKTSSATIAADGGGEFTIACDAGQRVVGGGFSSDAVVFNLDSHPSNDSTWRLYLFNGSSSAAAPVTIYATCIR
ncbi:MAG: hypothetical protein H0U82_01050 [Actinobacteria bacterium]|nr:hypothetical protein [Actinomycetota bacterium]